MSMSISKDPVTKCRASIAAGQLRGVKSMTQTYACCQEKLSKAHTGQNGVYNKWDTICKKEGWAWV